MKNVFMLKMGQGVGKEGAVVDSFGWTVMCACLPFDLWRHRHDTFKMCLEAILQAARIQTEL